MNTRVMPTFCPPSTYNYRTMDHATYKNNLSDPTQILEPEPSYQIDRNLLHVSSQYRDRAIYPDAGAFKVNLPEPYSDVVAIELVGGVLPFLPTLIGNPYIILDMGRDFENVQTLSGDSYFGILNLFQHSSGNAFVTIDRSNTEGKPKTFSPPLRNLTSLSIRLVYPDGSQVRFGDESPTGPMDFGGQTSFTFQIHTRSRRKVGIERDSRYLPPMQ